MHPSIYKVFFGVVLFFKYVIDVVVQVAGPLFVTVAATLMAACGYSFYVGILPYYTPFDTPLGILHTLWASWLVFNFVFNYFACIFTSPGISPDRLSDVGRKKKRKKERKPILTPPSPG